MKTGKLIIMAYRFCRFKIKNVSCLKCANLLVALVVLNRLPHCKSDVRSVVIFIGFTKNIT
jgi:hypothetical protein